MQEFSGWSHPTGELGALTAAAHVRSAALAGRAGELERRAADAPPARPFAAALRGDRVAVIAEVKRRSPSKGAIAPALAAGEQARAYAAGGAAALSILTEPDRFGGRESDVGEALAATAIPIVKKDFHVAPLQLVEARALGASAALLIARALPPRELTSLVQLAAELGLETLVEIRDERELDIALAAGARVIGVNNRNLETLVIDLATSDRVLPLVPGDCLAVFESGVHGPADVARAAEAGADAVLVGSSVSGATDPASAVRALTTVARLGRRVAA